MPTCIQCSAEAAPGSNRCVPHRDAQRARDREWRRAKRKQNREAGLCAGCGISSESYYCATCSGKAVDTVDTDSAYDSDISRLVVESGLSRSMSCEHRCDACRLDRIEEILVAVLAAVESERGREHAHYRNILERMNAMATKMEDLTAQVAGNTTVIESALTLIQGFSAQLDAAIAAARAGDEQALTDLAAQLKSEDDRLAAAVAANTGTQPTPSAQRRP